MGEKLRLAILLLAVIGVPIVGICVATAPLLQDLGLSPAEIPSFAFDCLLDRKPSWEHAGVCRALLPDHLLGLASVVAAGIGLVLLIGPMLVAALVGKSRFLMAISFPLVAFAALVFLSICTFLQTGILTASIAMLETRMIGRIHPYIILGVAAVGLAMAIGILVNAFSMFRKATQHLDGELITAEDAPDLHKAIADVAGRLQTNVPKNVVVGLDPTFFVSTSRIQLEPAGHSLKGQTLYLSLPLLRLMSPDEAQSIIGHELGHFTGKDTIYSERFAPAFAGLARARHAVTTDEATSTWSLPIVVVIDHLLGIFALPERRLSRDRELRADQIGARAGSPEALSSGLAKLSLLEVVWHAGLESAANRIFVGRPPRNLSLNFADTARFDIDHEAGLELARQALEHKTAHPVDTHPPTRLRIEALGVNADELVEPERFRSRLYPTHTLAHGPGIERLEERLTRIFENQLMRHIGKSKDPAHISDTMWALLQARLLANLVSADGPRDAAQIRAAEEAARAQSEDFDSVVFRECIRYANELPSQEDLIGEAKVALTAQGARDLIQLVRAATVNIGLTGPNLYTGLEHLEQGLAGLPEAPEPVETDAEPTRIQPEAIVAAEASQQETSAGRRRRRR